MRFYSQKFEQKAMFHLISLSLPPLQTNSDREAVEGKLEELRIQHDGLQELIATLKDGHGADKVVEWQGKMETVRLDDLRLKRDIEKLKYQVSAVLDRIVLENSLEGFILTGRLSASIAQW